MKVRITIPVIVDSAGNWIALEVGCGEYANKVDSRAVRANVDDLREQLSEKGACTTKVYYVEVEVDAPRPVLSEVVQGAVTA